LSVLIAGKPSVARNADARRVRKVVHSYLTRVKILFTGRRILGRQRVTHSKGEENITFTKLKKIALAALALTAGSAIVLTPIPLSNAADHAESTSVAGDPGADLADVFAFLDPNDNSKVVLALDVEGFVVPSELLNLRFFARDVLYRFEIENTGDAVPDQFGLTLRQRDAKERLDSDATLAQSSIGGSNSLPRFCYEWCTSRLVVLQNDFRDETTYFDPAGRKGT